MTIDLTEFLEIPFKVKQGGSNPPTAAKITEGDQVILSQISPKEYKIRVTTKDPELVFAPLTWDTFGNLGGNLVDALTLEPVPDSIVRVSFYAQEDPDSLKVLFGTIIETDPDSVGAWSADDQDP